MKALLQAGGTDPEGVIATSQSPRLQTSYRARREGMIPIQKDSPKATSWEEELV